MTELFEVLTAGGITYALVCSLDKVPPAYEQKEPLKTLCVIYTMFVMLATFGFSVWCFLNALFALANFHMPHFYIPVHIVRGDQY